MWASTALLSLPGSEQAEFLGGRRLLRRLSAELFGIKIEELAVSGLRWCLRCHELFAVSEMIPKSSAESLLSRSPPARNSACRYRQR